MATKRSTKETVEKHVGARLRELRRARGLTQEAVAEAAGCDPQTVQRAEVGKVALSVRRLATIAEALGVELATVFHDVGEPVPTSPWSADEAKAAAAWKRVPKARRALALRLLRDLAAEG